MPNLTPVYTQIKDLPQNTSISLTDEIPSQESSGGVGSTKKTSIQQIKTIINALEKSNNLSDISDIPVAKTNLGLNNVDNTSDLNKPISISTQMALTSIDIQMLKKADNLSDLSNINTAKTNLSLNNVDNTSDLNKPISNATQTVLTSLSNETLKMSNNLSDLTSKDSSVLNLKLGAGIKQFINLTSDLTLNNPCPNKIFISFQSLGNSVLLPLFNESQSISNVGVGYIFISNIGNVDFLVKKNDGTVLSTIHKDESYYFSPFNNLTGNPDFHVINASVVFDNSNLPTSNEKNALAGTNGEPSNTNKYVTNSDPRLNSSVTVSVTLYVSLVGNDTTGNGSITNPFLTLSHALSSITDNSPTKIYNVFFTAGEYIESETIFLKPFVNLTGESFGSVFLDVPYIYIDSSYGAVKPYDEYTYLENIVFSSVFNINFNQFFSAGQYNKKNIIIKFCEFKQQAICNSRVIPVFLYFNSCQFSSLSIDNVTILIDSSVCNGNSIIGNGAPFLQFNAKFKNSTVQSISSSPASSLGSVIFVNNTSYSNITISGDVALHIDSVSYTGNIVNNNATLILDTISDGLNANYIPVNYVVSGEALKSHLIGIDQKLQNSTNIQSDWNAIPPAINSILNKPVSTPDNIVNSLILRDSSGNFKSNNVNFKKLSISEEETDFVNVFETFAGNEILDQDTIGGSSIVLSSPNITWQSFKAGVSGKLTKIVFYFHNLPASNYICRLYSGSGIFGALLYQFTSFNGGTGGIVFLFPVSQNIVAGQQYTIGVEQTPAISNYSWLCAKENVYPDGESNVFGWDFRLLTYVDTTTQCYYIEPNGTNRFATFTTFKQNEPKKITESSLTLSFNPSIFIFNNSINGSYILPNPAGNSSSTLILKKISNNGINCLISHPVAKIDGEQSIVLTNQYSSLSLVNDGIDFFIV